MSRTITKLSILQALNNLMGKREMPGGTQSDLERYCQTAFDYAWRYYPWGFSLKRVTVNMITDPYLPTDFDLDGYHMIPSVPGSVWLEVPIQEIDGMSAGDRYYALEYETISGRYKIVTSMSVPSINFVYQVEPPTLGDEAVPFPSAMTVAVGAAAWAKQGENPRTADITQELDEFHNELDRHVGRAENHKPRHRPRNRQDVAGTFTGDVR